MLSNQTENNLFYNYALNEIKSQEDLAKQMLSMNTILISIYIALILNNQSMDAIRSFSNALSFGDGLSTLFYWIILLVPIICWFASMGYCFSVIEPRIKWAKSLFDEENSEYKSLKSINNYKLNSLKNGFISTMLGLGVIFLIMMFVIAYQLIGSSSDLRIYGWELYHQGKIDESIQTYNKALQLNPNNKDAWNELAIVLDHSGNHKEAIYAYEKALALDPDNSVIWHNKAYALQSDGQIDEANAAFNKATELGFRG